MKFTDTVTVSGARKRADGYLVADARVARTGIQLYAGHEMGRPDLSVVRVYRPADEVFSQDAMASFAHRPITDDHPREAVTADNWLMHAKGQTSDEVARDGTYLRVPLMVADGATIKRIEEGKRELSSGYTADIEWTAGKTEDGEQYDAVQRNIRANHVAIVRNGRAGSQVRIGDDANIWGAAPITTQQQKDGDTMSENLRNVLVDGLTVITTDQGAQAIAKLQQDLQSSAAKLADAENAHKTAIEAKDAEIKTKDEEIGTLKADLKKAQDAAPKPENLDKMVADRAELVTLVKTIDAKIETTGKTDAELRKAVVASKLGDEMVKDAGDDEIAGMFKAVAKDVKTSNPYADGVRNGVATVDGTVTDERDAYQKSIADLNARPNTGKEAA